MQQRSEAESSCLLPAATERQMVSKATSGQVKLVCKLCRVVVVDGTFSTSAALMTQSTSHLEHSQAVNLYSTQAPVRHMHVATPPHCRR